MHVKPYLGLIIALPLVFAANCAFAQAPSAATEAKLPLAIGAGFSGYNPELGHGHLLGGTLWIDYSPNKVPELLRGIGVEIEARDLNYGRSSEEPANLRQDMAGGGVFYSWPRYRNIRPYGKFERGFGNTDSLKINCPVTTPGCRYNQTRTVTALSGGVELRAFRSVWLRIDYEYQFWPDFFFRGSKPVAQLNSQGFTVGALYHFSRPHFH